MKEVWLMRHAETVANKDRVYQDADAELSVRGIQAARRLAAAWAAEGIRFPEIWTSTDARAKTTADFLAEALEIPVYESPSWRERRWPSSFEGLPANAEEVRRIREEIESRYHDPAWHYADEENFADFTRRARQALAAIEESGHDRLLVVTHHVFIKIILSAALFGDSLTPDRYLAMYHQFFLENLGVCRLRQVNGRWAVVGWGAVV